VQHDGERGFTFRFIRGDVVKEFGRFIVPAMIYRGVFQSSKTYEPGDTVTWDGSLWLAKKTTTAKPDQASQESQQAWALCAKRGRDGKPGPQGEKGLDGKPGKDGNSWRPS
jgi:hypothetical protein